MRVLTVNAFTVPAEPGSHNGSVNKVPQTYGDVDGFITMLMAACEDEVMNRTLETILSQPDKMRHAVLLGLLELFRVNGAPKDLSDAFVCLLDDEVAEKAYQVIYQCQRELSSPPAVSAPAPTSSAE